MRNTATGLKAACVVVLALGGFIGGLVPDLHAQTYTLDQVLAKMDEVSRTFNSMDASIERTKVTVLIDYRDTDSGEIYFTRNNSESRIKIEFKQPVEQYVLIEDGKARIHLPRLNQVQEFNLGNNQDKAEFLLIGFGQSNESIRQYYDASLGGEATIDGRRTVILDLKPKSADVAAMFTGIRLWLDQERWIPLQTQLTEASRDYQIVRFSNIRMNVNIPNSRFQLSLPRNVQVIRP